MVHNFRCSSGKRKLNVQLQCSRTIIKKYKNKTLWNIHNKKYMKLKKTRKLNVNPTNKKMSPDFTSLSVIPNINWQGCFWVYDACAFY